MIYLNESKDQQKTILEQLSDTKEVNRYHLMDIQKKETFSMCKIFWKDLSNFTYNTIEIFGSKNKFHYQIKSTTITW
jgi:hypothetical protein